MTPTRAAWLRFLTLLAVVVAAAYVFADELDLGRILALVAGASPVYLGLATLVYAASWPPRGARYREILLSTGYSCSTYAMTAAIFVSQTANLLFPARAGDASRAYVVKRRSDVPYSTGVASLAGERFLDVVVVAGFAAVGALYVVTTGGALDLQRHPEVVWGGVALVGLAVLAVGALLMASSKGVRGLERIPRVTESAADAVQGFVDDVAAVFEEPVAFARLMIWSVLAWGLDVAAGALVLLALDVGISVAAPAALVGVSVGNLAKAVPATPGGLGVYEAGFAASVTAAFPVAWQAAVAAAVVDHALKNAFTVAGGVVSAVALNVSLTSMEPEDA